MEVCLTSGVIKIPYPVSLIFYSHVTNVQHIEVLNEILETHPAVKVYAKNTLTEAVMHYMSKGERSLGGGGSPIF